ncbi:hypothetical protein HY008_02885 [Candidatus Woesebacteria bacterium]|nr:hypothetical protein [Candidatus Woesebacteria bacterium]
MDSLEWIFLGIVFMLAAGLSGLGGLPSSLPSSPGSPTIPTTAPVATPIPTATPTLPGGGPTATPTPGTAACIDCEPDGCWPINVARSMVAFAQSINPSVVESSSLGKATQAVCREKQKHLPETLLANRLSTYGFTGTNVEEYVDLINVTSCGSDLNCQAQTAWNSLKTSHDLENKLRSGNFNRIGTGHCSAFWSVIIGRE